MPATPMARISETSLSQSIAPEKADTKGSGDVEIDIERTATAGTTHNGSSSDISAVGSAGYHRSLTRRKVMMMTFGAGIGTGLWVGTGQALLYGKLMGYLHRAWFNRPRGTLC